MIFEMTWCVAVDCSSSQFTWTGNKKFRKCCGHSHGSPESKHELSPKSEAFKALQHIGLDKETLDDLPTGVLDLSFFIEQNGS